MKNIVIILLYVYLCKLYANDVNELDSKGRSFWDKKFVLYNTNTSLIAKLATMKMVQRTGIAFN